MFESCDDNGVCDFIPDDGIFADPACDDNGNCGVWSVDGSGDCPLGQTPDDNGICDYSGVGTTGTGVKKTGGGGWASVGSFLSKLFGGVAGQVGGVRPGSTQGSKSCVGYDTSGRPVSVQVPRGGACPSGTSLKGLVNSGNNSNNNNMLLLAFAGVAVVILVARK